PAVEPLLELGLALLLAVAAEVGGELRLPGTRLERALDEHIALPILHGQGRAIGDLEGRIGDFHLAFALSVGRDGGDGGAGVIEIDRIGGVRSGPGDVEIERGLGLVALVILITLVALITLIILTLIILTLIILIALIILVALIALIVLREHGDTLRGAVAGEH